MKSSTLHPTTFVQRTQKIKVNIEFLRRKNLNFRQSPVNSRKYLRKGGRIDSCIGIECGAKTEIMEVKT